MRTRDSIFQANRTITSLKATVSSLRSESRQKDLKLAAQERELVQLRQLVAQLRAGTMAPAGPALAALPSFVKPNVPDRPKRKPGREVGHAPALRPIPPKIDRHQDVPLPTDGKRNPVCPRCKGRLQRIKSLKRIVEDLIPQLIQVTCYHTQSGFCVTCDKVVESRAPEQPPAADVPHGQLGINALATAAILRVRHRLPYRQITQLLKDMPGLAVSPGAIVKQIKRVAQWLDKKYQALLERMRASKHVHVDETGWRIDGKNVWLWAFTDPTFTLYHMARTRAGQVARDMLGESYQGTVVSDFYGGYDAREGPKQKCLTHLMREVKELSEADEWFASNPWSRKLMRWCRDALKLKKRWDQLEDEVYERKASRLEDQLDQLAQAMPTHPDGLRLAKRLTKHRKDLTRFLWDKDLEGTNNPAERALRPAVVMRKITGGNRSESGAHAWAKLASLLRTADQEGLDVFAATKKLIMDYWATADEAE